MCTSGSTDASDGNDARHIPQSQALAEASPESLSELLSRDPEGYTRQDRQRVIEALRANRARFVESELAKPKTKPKASPKGALVQAVTQQSLDDFLG